MKRLIRRILCKCGYHHYLNSMMQVRYREEKIDRHDQTVWKYVVSLECTFCNYTKNQIIYIPNPLKEARND